MKLINNNEKGKVYSGSDLKIFYRKNRSISGDNDVNSYEKIYLIKGEVELTIADKVRNITAPAEFEIPENTYHKIVALKDVVFVLLK